MLHIIRASDRDPWARSTDAVDWCRENGIEAQDTYKFCIDPDAMTAEVWQYDRNADGRVYRDAQTGEVAEREPFTVPIKTLPEPVRLARE